MTELKNNLFENITDTPKEHYTFNFSSEEIAPVEKKYMGILIKRMIVSIVASMILIICGILSHTVIIGIAAGILFISLVSHIKSISAYKKIYAKSRDKYPRTVYDYTLYDNFLVIWISSDTSIRQTKVLYTDIKKAQIIADLVVLEIEGQLFLMRKSELAKDSFFLKACMLLSKNK